MGSYLKSIQFLLVWENEKRLEMDGDVGGTII